MPRTSIREPYHLSQAWAHTRLLREKVIIQLARAIEERGWTQSQAAAYLRVRQPRISDLKRGQTHKFTLDTLIEMLFALDRPVTIVIDENPDWERSALPPHTVQEYQEAVAYYTRAIHLDPTNSRAYAMRGDAYGGLKEYDLAIGDYTRCIELEPDRPGMRGNRATLFMRAGQYRAALQDCEELLRLAPDYDVYATRGLVFSRMGHPEKAIEDFTRSIEMEPQRTGSYWNRAQCYERMGNAEAARADYQMVSRLDPSSKAARALGNR